MESLSEDKHIAVIPLGSLSAKGTEYSSVVILQGDVFMHSCIISNQMIVYLQTQPPLNYSAHLFQDEGCPQHRCSCLYRTPV